MKGDFSFNYCRIDKGFKLKDFFHSIDKWVRCKIGQAHITGDIFRDDYVSSFFILQALVFLYDKSINIETPLLLSVLGGRMRSSTSLFAWIFPRLASCMALQQSSSISPSKRAFAAVVALFLVLLGLPTGLVRRPK